MVTTEDILGGKDLKKFLSSLFQPPYVRICRTYARYFINDKPADPLYKLLCSLQFWRTHHFWPNLKSPTRFTEKLFHRMLFDRNPQLTLLNDKFRVRAYVAAKAGEDYLIPLLWAGENPEDIPFDKLPSKYVIKANHGCGYNILVTDNAQSHPNRIKKQLKNWLGKNYCLNFGLGIEWGYKNILPTIIIESFIGGKNGKEPVDYKFYCFSGRVEFLTLHFDRFSEHKTKAFDRKFEPHEFRYQFGQWSGECQRPSNFESMVQLAEVLAEGFDFMRVDIYSVENRIYFSEYTPYPGGTTTKFLPLSQDFLLGEKWQSK